MTTTRTQFLVDLLSTAVEVGISYWGDTIQVEDSTGVTPEGDNLDPIGSGGNAYVAIVREDETGEEHRVNLDTIAKGAKLLSESAISNQLVNDFREADQTNGGRGDFDAGSADMALQMGIFGEIVYG